MSRDLAAPAPRTVKMNEADQLKALLACTTVDEVTKLVNKYPGVKRESVYVPKLKAIITLGSQLTPARFKAESFRPQFRQGKADLLLKVMEDGKTIYCHGPPGNGRTQWFETFFGADMRVYYCSPITMGVGFDDILRGLNKWPKIIQWNIYDDSSFKTEELLNFVSPGEVPWTHAMKIPESYYIPKNVCRIINTWMEPTELMTSLGLTPDEIVKFMASIYVWNVDLSLLENETTKQGLKMPQKRNGPESVGSKRTAEGGAGKRKKTC